MISSNRLQRYIFFLNNPNLALFFANKWLYQPKFEIIHTSMQRQKPIRRSWPAFVIYSFAFWYLDIYLSSCVISYLNLSCFGDFLDYPSGKAERSTSLEMTKRVCHCNTLLIVIPSAVEGSQRSLHALRLVEMTRGRGRLIEMTGDVSPVKGEGFYAGL